MRKILSLLLALTLVFALVACSNEKDTASKPDTSTTQTETESTNNTETTDSDTIDESSSGNKIPSNSTTISTETSTPADITSKPIVSSKLTQTNTSESTHTHNYSKATCTTPPTCSCGETKGSVLGHKWSDSVCMMQRVCERCKITDKTIVSHTFSKYLCEKCGKIDPESNVFWGVNAFLTKYGKANGKGNINCYPNEFAALSVSNYINQNNFFIEYREDATGEVFSVWVKSGVSTVSFRRGSTYGSYEMKNSVLCSTEKVVFDDFSTNPDNPTDRDVFASECASKIDKYLRMAESKILIPKMGLKLSDFGFVKYK